MIQTYCEGTQVNINTVHFVTGIVEGVGSGLALAAILGAVSYFFRCWQRRRQVKHISKLIIEFRTRIFSVRAAQYYPGPDKKFSVDEIRGAYFADLRRQLDAALLGNASRLTFDEREAVRTIFLGLHNLYPQFLPNEGWYVSTFEKAESPKWLKVPPMNPRP